jgi:hypothetical protein
MTGRLLTNCKMAAAASFPACTASTTSLPPLTQSPPANTPAILVPAPRIHYHLPAVMAQTGIADQHAKRHLPRSLDDHIHFQRHRLACIDRRTPAGAIRITQPHPAANQPGQPAVITNSSLRRCQPKYPAAVEPCNIKLGLRAGHFGFGAPVDQRHFACS